jgi:hypothetical protein
MENNDIKVGDIVYIKTNPDTYITVTSVEKGKVQGVYKDPTTNKLLYAPSVPISCVVKVEP